MNELSSERQLRWQQIVEQLEQEFQSLPSLEKKRIAELLKQMKLLQKSLDHLFRKAEGEQVCTACEGACCAKGHNHVVLPNLLAYLQEEKVFPEPDFTGTCPWLGPLGCAHEVGHRPYNCITFLCDKLEEHLESTDVEEFYRLDQELRQLYKGFAERYAGGGMSGLLLQTARLNGRPLLALRAGTDDSNKRQEPV